MSLTQVIIPVDFSDGSLTAVDCGRDLARRADTSTQVVAVTTSRYVNVTDDALTALVAQGDQSATKKASWRVLVSDDDDVEATLIDAVLADPDALWCVASHGRTAIGELLFGSVSADLVRDAGVPLVVVGRHAVPRPDAQVIAVALDGSPASEQVLPAALWLAGSLGMRVRLVQVGTPHPPIDGMDTAYLARVARRLPHPEAADYDVLYGDVADALTSYVDGMKDVAMLAMTTRGASTTARLSAPSVAMHVVRRSPVPVMLLHPPVVSPTTDTAEPSGESVGLAPVADLRRRVVVGIDTFDASRDAVEFAAAEAIERGAMLQLVHTWQVPITASSMYEAAVWPDITVCERAAFEEMTLAAEAVADQYPDLVIDTVVAEGRAADAIAKQAAGAELVVLGQSHHGRLERWLAGSTTKGLAGHLDCPLVIVPCDHEPTTSS
jgi:nucleotide-binding universal stress UspA family protein